MRILSNSLFGRINCVFLWYNKEKLCCRYAEKSMNAFLPGIACGLGIVWVQPGSNANVHC